MTEPPIPAFYDVRENLMAASDYLHLCAEIYAEEPNDGALALAHIDTLAKLADSHVQLATVLLGVAPGWEGKPDA